MQMMSTIITENVKLSVAGTSGEKTRKEKLDT